MSAITNQNTPNLTPKQSLGELLKTTKEIWKYLLSKWGMILIFGLSGAAIGLIVSIVSKPTYKAHLSFALIDNSGGGSSLVALASTFGLGNFGMSDDAFSGDNLLEILKSRHAIEQALLTTVKLNGVQKKLIDVYLDMKDMREKWPRSKNIELHTLKFPVNQKREQFSRTQDSVLYSVYNKIKESNQLTIARIDKKIGIVNVDYESENELFSKLFVENLLEQTSAYYKSTRTAQTRANIEMMEDKADSIKRLYEGALYKSTTYSQLNLNIAQPTATAPRRKQENDATLYGTVYSEVLKNLESLKLDLARQTPLVQIIDTPILPLEKQRIGKTKGTVLGGLLGGFIIVFWLLTIRYLNNKEVSKKRILFKTSYQ